MKRKSLDFADAHLRARWETGPPAVVMRALELREKRYDHGEVYLSRLDFAITDRNEPVLIRGKNVLHLSRLGWARFSDALKINRAFVRERLATGPLGRKYLAQLANDITKKQVPNLRRTIFLFEVDEHSYVVREMAKDPKEAMIPSEKALFEYMQAHAWAPKRDPELVGFRLSDYGHAFRYLVQRSTNELTPAVALDVCASVTRKQYYVQGVILLPLGGERFVPCRVDHREIGGKTLFMHLGSLPEAARQALDATLDSIPAFVGKWHGRERPAPGAEVLAAVKRCSHERQAHRDMRRILLSRMVTTSWNRPLTMEVALECIAESIMHDTDMPEWSNRMERIANTLALGDYKTKEIDLRSARELLKLVRPEKVTIEPRTWSQAVSSGAAG